MKVFVVGGTGFIGSYVVNELLGNGHKVTLFARNPGKIPLFAGNSAVTMVEGDFKDGELLAERLGGHDACIHLALGGTGTATEAILEDLLPSVALFEAAVKAGIGKLLATTTVGTFGNADAKYSEMCPARPVAFYGASKEAAQAFVYAMSRMYPVKANCIAPAFTFGSPLCEGTTLSGITDPRFYDIVRCARSGDDIFVKTGQGTQFIHAADIAKVYASVIASEQTGRVYVAMGRDYITWEEVARYVTEYLHSGSKVIVGDEGIGVAGVDNPQKNYPADLSAIRDDFGLDFPTRDKLHAYLRWLSDNWDIPGKEGME
jgi:UDP-glucose 4-epimerase